MDGIRQAVPRVGAARAEALNFAQVDGCHADAFTLLAAQLRDEPLSAVCVFGQTAQLQGRLVTALSGALGGIPSVTLPAAHAQNNQIYAIGFPARLFAADLVVLPTITDEFGTLQMDLLQRRMAIRHSAPDMAFEAALVCTGTTLPLQPVISALPQDATLTAQVAATAESPASALILRSHCEIDIVASDAIEATPTRLVVTAADQTTHRITELNAAPVTEELTRVLSCDTSELHQALTHSIPLLTRSAQGHIAALNASLDGDVLVTESGPIPEGTILMLGRTKSADEQATELASQIRPNRQIITFDARATSTTKDVTTVRVDHVTVGNRPFHRGLAAMVFSPPLGI